MLALNIIFIFIFALISLVSGVEYNDSIILTQSGWVRGSERNNTNGGVYYAFNGIPYAKPPINELRFEAPQPPANWDGVFDASRKVYCLQWDYANYTDTMLGDEDCLVLNVYIPTIPVQDFTPILPVMVFIHGGGFDIGTGEEDFYGANILMNRNIVLVTINYRVDAFGFLSMKDDVLPGNYGMLDQVAALEWVQKNIKNFGGDRSKVTVFGQSAGGSSVTHLLLSPKAKGLFHAAIAQSGSSFCNFAIQKLPRENARILATKLKCPTHPSIELKNCLKNKTALEIFKKLKDFDLMRFMPFVFTPVVEERENGFLPDYPEKLLEKIFTKVPIIIGINEKEGVWINQIVEEYAGAPGKKFLKEDFPAIAEYALIGAKYEGKDIVGEYFEGVNVNDNKTFQDTMIEIYSDNFACGIYEMANLIVKRDYPVYVYRFTYRGTEDDTSGVDHSSDLTYLFSSSFAPPLSGDNKKMSDIFLDLWTNFAKHHNPIPNNEARKLGTNWLPSTKGNIRYLELNLKPKMKSGLPLNRTQFWIPEEKDD